MTPNVKRLTNDSLLQLYIQVSEELRTRAMSQLPDPVVAIKGQDEGKRALTVAAAGSHPIMFVGPSQTGKSMFVAAAAKLGVTAFEAQPCPCGFFGHPEIECKCFPSIIQSYWRKQKHYRLLNSVDMLVVLRPIPPDVILSAQPGLRLEDVQDALRRRIPFPAFDEHADEGAWTLLKYAMKESRLLPGIIDKAKRVSATIAALGQLGMIQAAHVQEALSYRPVLNRIIH